MPRHLNPCSYLPRRLQIVASLSTFILFCIIFLGTSSSDDIDPYLNKVPLGPELKSGAQRAYEASQNFLDKIPPSPSWLNPFKAPAHSPPPEQANSTSGEVRWYSDWDWKNPFSSSVTDDQRAVLPPLRQRPPVYTYYSATGTRKDEKRRKAEQELLQIWRRAWWAQGFLPVILTDSEAERNPLYRQVQGLKLTPTVETELMQWLAWGNMGTGVFSNWLALPMAAYNHPVLSFLRRGEFPALTGFKGLNGAVYYGSRQHIELALKEVIKSPAIQHIESISEGLPRDYIQEDSPQDAIAFYNKKTIDANYSPIRDLLANETRRGDALAMLAPLINAHLHITWQSIFTKGVAVVNPFPQFSTNLVEPAMDIARNLSRCPDTPIPNSCPPNRPSCKPCARGKIPVDTPVDFRNDSALFSIATVPHPYTLITLTKQRDKFDLPFVRRDTPRDAWVLAASAHLFGAGPSSFARLPGLKDAVASENGSATSLWLTPERDAGRDRGPDPVDLDWTFGFTLPRHTGDDDAKESKSGKTEAAAAPGVAAQGPVPAKEPMPSELAAEKGRLLASERALRQDVRMRDVVEAWNMADTEIWKFARAFGARRRVERTKWEEAEKGFQGKGTFDRWVDKFT